MGAFLDQFVDWVSGSSWSYFVIFAVAVIDGFFPLVPSETVAVAGGVLAGTGDLSLPFVILAASAGAIVGDNISYGLGKWLGEHTVKRLFRSEKAKRGFLWAEHQLEERGTYLIVVARFIPGGRTATTFAAGYTHAFTWRRFIVADVIAGVIWGTYCGLIGYLGGSSFKEEPWKGLLIAFAIAIAITFTIEGTRWIRHRRAAQRLPAPEPEAD